jgi:hypothetical protein
VTRLHRIVPLAFVAACTFQSGVGVSRPGGASPPAPTAGSAAGASGAHRDASGRLVFPGGDLSSRKGTCGAAGNHCLRQDAWFVTGADLDAQLEAGKGAGVTVAFAFEGTWWTWRHAPEEVAARTALRTAAAAPATVKPGDPVIWWTDRYTRHPDSEYTAHTAGHWTLGVASAVGETIRVGIHDVPFESARVVVERR